MFQRALHDENTGARIGASAPNKDVLMSAKKTAFSDVKNLLNTNTPSGASLTGIKKPVFGSKFRANVDIKAGPIETKGAANIKNKNFKPRFDLSSIDYSGDMPHSSCTASSGDIMCDFWSTSSRFEIYQEKPTPAKAVIPDDLQCPPIKLPEIDWDIPEPPPALLPELEFDFPPNMFNDDYLPLPPAAAAAFPSISFDDF